jgi:HEPN domain-containing protein
MKTDENNPEDWYRSAKVRLGSADRLYPLEGMSESVIELLQESAERYLKGYIISKGWALSRIHDLGALIAEAQRYDGRFGEFAEQSLDFHEVRTRLDGMLKLIAGR